MSLFRSSPETELLVTRLRQAQADGELKLSYEELSRLVGMSVQEGRGYSCCSTARKRVQEEDGVVWKTEHGRGLYFVPHAERARIGEATAKKVRRQVHRDKKVLRTTDFTKLKTTSEQDAFNVSAARLAVLGMAASRKVGNRLAANVEEVRGITEVPLTKALDIMRGCYPNRPNKKDDSGDDETPPAGNPRAEDA